MLSMYKSKQTRMIKKLKMLQKVKEQGIRFWNVRTFWYEIF